MTLIFLLKVLSTAIDNIEIRQASKKTVVIIDFNLVSYL